MSGQVAAEIKEAYQQYTQQLHAAYKKLGLVVGKGVGVPQANGENAEARARARVAVARAWSGTSLLTLLVSPAATT